MIIAFVEILINVIQASFFAIFTGFFLKPKKQFSRGFVATIPYLAITLVVALSITFYDYLAVYEGIGMFLYSIVSFPLILLCMDGKFFEKLFVCLIPTNAITFGANLGTNLMAIILNKPILDFVLTSNWERYITVIISNAISLLMILIILLISKRNPAKINNHEWFVLSAATSLSVFIFTVLFNETLVKTNVSDTIPLVCAIATLALINILLFYMLVAYGKRSKVEMENSMLKQHCDMQTMALEGTKTQYSKLRKERHAFNNTLVILDGISKKNNYTEVSKYIDEYLHEQNSIMDIISTDNKYVDALLNAKLSLASNKNIAVYSVITPKITTKNDIDLCNLLGNLIDNAIEGCSSDNGIIELNIGYDQLGMLHIMIKNSIDASVLDSNPQLHTTKENKTAHGYGVQIVREIAERYNGYVDFYENDGYFCCDCKLKI